MNTDNLLFGDQADKMPDEYNVELGLGLKVLTPIKKQKGAKELIDRGQKNRNGGLRMKQLIEALFSWLNKQ
ncbi:MAG: hypothetical protein KAH18_10715 [Psychromonas sp.]|nr:hypothetical protein [Psychromonas sp.]